MQYTVVHSTDPYLLARLATDLQMEGVETDDKWNERFHPFRNGFEWLAIYVKIPFNFHNHACDIVRIPIRHELTSRNYIKVLTKILEP